MGSAWRFAKKVGGTVQTVNDSGKGVMALAIACFGIFAAGVGKAFGVGWGVAAFFAALSAVLFFAGVRVQRQLEERPPLPAPQMTFIGTTMSNVGAMIGYGDVHVSERMLTPPVIQDPPDVDVESRG